jgi:formyltetrahydrofolate hydrolase
LSRVPAASPLTVRCQIESVALNRAVRWHVEHRLFVHGNRTVVLR